MAERISQNRRLLDYLLEHEEGLTAVSALVELGIGRMSARVWELRNKGIMVEGKNESGKDRYGNTATYARYSIPRWAVDTAKKIGEREKL